MKCKTCKHYHYYEMINRGPYLNDGLIPCLFCLERVFFPKLKDNYEPIEPKEVDNADEKPPSP